MKRFIEYFWQKCKIIHDRSMFNPRTQQESETIEEFVRALNTLIKHCDNADPDEQVRDRLVIGLRDRQLTEKLQLQSDLTSQKAITMACQTANQTANARANKAV